MSIDTFDPDKHHISLAEVGASSDGYGFVTTGQYVRGFKRIKESEMDGVRYGGGDSLVNKPGVSSWTMDDFTGGAFQYVWGKDPAMFAKSINALPSQFDRSIRSVPALQQWFDGKRLTTPEVPLLVCAYNGYLAAVFEASVERWALLDGAHASDAVGAAGGVHHACFVREQGVILHAINSTISASAVDVFPGLLYSFAKPAAAYGNVTGLNADGDRAAIAYNDVLWTVPMNDDRTVQPDSTQWTRIGRVPGHWVDSVWQSGLLYILLGGYDTPTSVVAFDGTQILPICDFPYNFQGQTIRSYGGRLYVGGTGADIQTGNPKYAELYEITGSSLRLLKTFAPELLGAGDVYGTGVYSMCIHEGLLFFGVKGWGLIAYDLTTDAFYGASTFAVADSSAEFRHLLSARESLFSWVYPIASSPGESGWFRPATSQETVASYDTYVETSDFATAFDRLKRWRELRVLTRFASAGMSCDYSVDGGNTWTALPAATIEISGRFLFYTFSLDDVADSRMIRFRFKLTNGTSVSAFRELVGFTASFRMLDSDSIDSGQHEKLAWSFVICGAERPEGLDRTVVHQDVAAIHDQLWDWARERKHLHFRDLDGQVFTVEIDTIEETQAVVFPELDTTDPIDASPLSGREALYNVTLVEV